MKDNVLVRVIDKAIMNIECNFKVSLFGWSDPSAQFQDLASILVYYIDGLIIAFVLISDKDELAPFHEKLITIRRKVVKYFNIELKPNFSLQIEIVEELLVLLLD